MPGSLRVDVSEVDTVAKILTAASETALADVVAVVGKGAFNIKTDARQRISGHPRLRALPASITYDTGMTRSSAWAEIGPDKSKRQGPLGNIAEYGTPRTAPHPFMLPASDAEEPRFVSALEALAAKALGQ